MAGLLSSRNRGLLGAFQDQQGRPLSTADKMRQAMSAPEPMAPQPPENAARQGLLSTIQAPPQQQQRGPGLTDWIWGLASGYSPNDVRQIVADRQPDPMAAQQRQAIASTIEDPRELALFLQDPESWSKNVGQQYAPQVIAAGSGQAIGGRITSEMPSYTESGDQILRRDSQGVQPVFTRTAPSIRETIEGRNADTAKLAASRPVILGPGQIATSPESGAEIARGAPRQVVVGDGAELYGEDGTRVAQNARDTPPVDPQARANANRAAFETIGNTRAAVARARSQAGAFTTGFGSLLSVIPGTPAADLKASIDTVQANLSFAELAKMRAQSPTGGALGSIAVRELDLLGATVASLGQSQSQAEFERSLDVIDASLARWEAAVRASEAQSTQARPASTGGQIAEDANGNRVQWNGQAWVPIR